MPQVYIGYSVLLIMGSGWGGIGGLVARLGDVRAQRV